MNIILLVVLGFTILFILQNIVENKNGLNDIMNKVTDNAITKHFDSIKKSRDESRKFVKEK